MESLMKAVCESETGVDLLESFNVAETRAGEGVKSLGTCLVSGKLSNLKLLYLNRSGVSDEGMLSVALAVEGGHLGGLRVLDLSQNDFGRNGAEAFFASLSPSSCSFLPPHSETPVSIKGGGRLPFLESLLVYETRAGESISLFARVLQKDHCPNIRSLDFDNAGVGDSGIVSLSEIFHHTSLPSLLHLGLRRNNIGIEGLTTFLEALLPSSLPRLHWLFLEGNPLAVHVSESRFLFQKARKEGKLPRLESPML
uniref:Uncharacterized protein n=1 Tax=Chromera velia CCMP2878 TaxID=1169474 RepID=A0A0G4I239_9ALVE|eukprot:Cvel_10273.t1-p1 / transcript=Cvel_10273.t1 / gene=Cvel_10273 / organism=Chromera_velia_CCMP2878 / gene_product=hypothetical protein / transcript_product=hypothetical protein / location=Cvel_scaffold616:39726-40484(-) / protein_length=253 / sequence_SO=supercontig / SO=protein_coding / is_pseudo=false